MRIKDALSGIAAPGGDPTPTGEPAIP